MYTSNSSDCRVSVRIHELRIWCRKTQESGIVAPTYKSIHAHTISLYPRGYASQSNTEVLRAKAKCRVSVTIKRFHNPKNISHIYINIYKFYYHSPLNL